MHTEKVLCNPQQSEQTTITYGQLREMSDLRLCFYYCVLWNGMESHVTVGIVDEIVSSVTESKEMLIYAITTRTSACRLLLFDMMLVITSQYFVINIQAKVL